MGLFQKDLRLRITALLLTLILLSSATSIGVSYLLASNIMHNRIDESTITITNLVRGLLNTAIDRRLAKMRLITSYPMFRNPESSPAEMTRFINIILETWPIAGKGVFTDTNGNPLAGSSEIIAAGNVSRTEWFKYAQMALLVLFYIDSTAELEKLSSTEPLLAVSSPTRDELGQIFGYLILFTTLTDIKDALSVARVGKTGIGYLVDSEGSLIAGSSSNPLLDRKTRKINSSDALRIITSGNTGMSTVSRQSKSLFVSFSKVQPDIKHGVGIDWYTGIVMDSKEAFSDINKTTIYLFLVAIAFLVAGGFLAVTVGRNMTEPILELSTVTKRIGSGDLTGDIPMRTNDQIGTLAASITRMRDSLKELISEARASAERVSSLAKEQSAATADILGNLEEIVDSVVKLEKNVESQAQRLRKLTEYTESMSKEARDSQSYKEAREILTEAEVLAEAGSERAVEIAAASQELRSAASEVASAARRLSIMASELQDLVARFKLHD